MPHISTRRRRVVRLYYEEAGAGTPVVFVHEYARGLPHLGAADAAFRRARTVASPTASAAIRRPTCPRTPTNTPRTFSATTSIAVMDALKIDKAHVVGHSMGAATALHVGIHYPKRCISVTAAGCGYGSSADPKVVESRARPRARTARCSPRTHGGGRARYGDGADPAGAEEQGPARLRAIHQDAERALAARPCADHAESAGQAADAVGHGSRPEEIPPPLLVIVGDEDEWCVDASVYLQAARRRPPGCCVVPRSGHTITSEEPDEVQRRARRIVRRGRSRPLAGA